MMNWNKKGAMMVNVVIVATLNARMMGQLRHGGCSRNFPLEEPNGDNVASKSHYYCDLRAHVAITIAIKFT